jgi:hypothetical protein
MRRIIKTEVDSIWRPAIMGELIRLLATNDIHDVNYRLIRMQGFSNLLFIGWLIFCVCNGIPAPKVEQDNHNLVAGDR